MNEYSPVGRTSGKNGRRLSGRALALVRAVGTLAAVAVVGLLVPLVARSHIVREEPWHPAPAAYLRTIFYLNLEPLDWPAVAMEMETIQDPDWPQRSVYEVMALASAHSATDHEAEIRHAIAAQDATAYYAASTRALSQLTRHWLGEAEDALQRPGEALEPLRQAQRMYRAFAGFIDETDPSASHDLGIAWLEMSSSVGSVGVGTAPGTASALDRFVAARREVEDYLIANYEAPSFSPRSPFVPVPERIAALGSFEVSPWLPPGTDMNDQDPLPRLVLNFESHGVDERDLFLVAYGDMLFDSPEIFGDPARSLGLSCARCHNRSDINNRFFIPGISARPGSADVDGHFFNPRFNDRRSDSLDIPSLRGIRFTGPYGRDGRFGSLRDFTRNVVVNEFAGPEPTAMMLDALIAYMFEFDWLPSPYLNRDGSLNEQASVAARRGEEIFTRPLAGLGNQSCSTCHIPSSNFVDGLRRDIGYGGSSPTARDAFFDTPTLINVAHTAPYMHDGSLETLGDVVEWFDAEFGLSFSEGDKQDLTAYLEAVGTGEDPYEIFDEENTPFRLFFDELSTFISTLDTLIPARDKFHAELLINTVATDMRLDASALQDRSQAPVVYALAGRLVEIGNAIGANDWRQAAALWEQYKIAEAEHGPALR